MSFFSQHKLVIILAAILIALGVWYAISSSSPVTPILATDTPVAGAALDPADQELVGSLLTLRAVSLAGEIFNDPGYRSLQDFSTTIIPEPVGRQNPFQPLQVAASSSAAASHQVQIFAPRR